MKPLFSKLHAFVSLATPHVGSLFPDSQIVSTGMWALFKWKKYKALKVRLFFDLVALPCWHSHSVITFDCAPPPPS
jgi:hypothetical protein